MWHDPRWMLGAALLAVLGCGDGGTGPGGDTDGRRLAAQFQQLADSVDSAGYSPTADALRHAAEIVRLTGHATPVTLTIDGASRSFLAVAEQIDFPNLVCSWPGDSGVAPPPDTVVVPPPLPPDSVIVQPGDSGSGVAPTPLTVMDSVVPPSGGGGGTPGECTEAGVFSMRTLIAWEPERMAEVVRIVADVGSNGVEAGVPDVMVGLPTNAAGADPNGPTEPPVPGDSTGGGGGGGWSGYPGFMGEYLVRDVGSWFAVEGRQANAMEDIAGACTSSRAAFDWAEFTCQATRFRFEFSMRVEPLVFIDPLPPAEPIPASGQPQGEHAIAMATAGIDGVRLAVVAWTPPPLPSPGPLPPDSTVGGAPDGSVGR